LHNDVILHVTCNEQIERCRIRLSYLKLYYQAEVCWQISNTIKQTSVGKSCIGLLSSRRLLGNLEYYQTDVCWEISNTIKQIGCWQISNTMKPTTWI